MRRALAIAVALCAAPGVAAANPVDLFGFGARISAMGGAGTAAAEGVAANYYNPGALADDTDLELLCGYQYAQPHLSINGGDQHVDVSRGLALGLVVPARLHGRHIFTFGAGLFLPDEHLILGRTLPSPQPRWALYDNRPQRLFFGGHAAVRLPHGIAVGAGVGLMAETDGQYALSGRLGYPDSLDSDLGLDVDVKVKPVVYPQAGIIWQARPWLRVGATYRGEFVLHTLQIIAFNADIGPSGQQPIVDDAYLRLHATALDLFQPAQLAVGFAARAGRLLVAGDLTWERWSRFDNPTPDIQLDFDVGTFNQFVNLPPSRPLPAAHFHDIATLRAGGELTVGRTRHLTARARAGYAWSPSPVPEQVGESNFVDGDKHTVSLGGGLEVRNAIAALARPFDVDLEVGATVLPSRRTHKLDPVDPIGDYRARGLILTASVTTRWRI